MKFNLLIILIFGISFSSISQIDPNDIEIVRDSFGVPHIYAKTDAQVAYGLAWAHAEDDFETIQYAYLAGNGLLGHYLGKDGIGADFLASFIGSEELYIKKFNTDISPEYIKVLEGYSAGLNSYAKHNPDEVLSSKLFPVTPKKMMKYGQLQLFMSSRGDYWVSRILNNNLDFDPINQTPIGSNTFAFNSQKTTDGNTYLAINTHQPLDGPVSWYEAHLCSEEGTNILGALFAGSPSILIGVNENLGWAHTVNLPDKTDVFVLEMHPNKKLKYRVDDQYLDLEVHKAKLTLKILGISIGIKKKYYKSIYGPTLKTDQGFFSIRTPALFEIRALEQWWRMNKAKNFSEFYDILKMKAVPGYNIGYADKNDTIFYISNGLIPKRAAGYNWKGVVQGNTKDNLWEETYDIEDLPQVIQPKSGYFYNANHTPFKSTDSLENPPSDNFSKDMGFEEYDNNRSTRLKQLIDGFDLISYSDFKRIKYDTKFPEKFNYSFMNIDSLFLIDPDKYPNLKPIIKEIQEWDRETHANSYGAGAYGILYSYLRKYYNKLPQPKIFTQEYLIEGLKETKNHMLKYFGKTRVMLGEYQKLVRGNKELPSFGLPDVITAMTSTKYKEGKVRVVSGESYIELVKFTDSGPEIESIISYGSSDKKGSEHYSDQMELYLSFKTKKMTLDKGKVYENAKDIYSPK
jgi:acyl-homoserine-lactone acylase